MLSPQERQLIVGILLVLLLGGVVKSCRSRVTVEQGPRDVLPSVEEPGAGAERKPDPRAD